VPAGSDATSVERAVPAGSDATSVVRPGTGCGTPPARGSARPGT
jgi:hypothetical protein